MPAATSGEYVTVYMTAENDDMANHMAIALLKERLAACANVMGTGRSIFEWDGTLQLETETVVLLKSRRDKVKTLIERVREMHSYEVPCLTVMPIVDGNPEYLAWVDAQLDKEVHDTGADEEF